MKTIVLTVLVSLGTLLVVKPGGKSDHKDPSVETYEHLATAIIALRQTEDGLVKGILMHYESAAERALREAEHATGGAKTTALEKAATQISHIANEGDKPIQAIKQRLLQAGHHHHNDAETKEDYLWINSKEKKHFLDLAQKVSKLGADASAADIAKAREELSAAFTKATAAE